MSVPAHLNLSDTEISSIIKPFKDRKKQITDLQKVVENIESKRTAIQEKPFYVNMRTNNINLFNIIQTNIQSTYFYDSIDTTNQYTQRNDFNEGTIKDDIRYKTNILLTEYVYRANVNNALNYIGLNTTGIRLTLTYQNENNKAILENIYNSYIYNDSLYAFNELDMFPPVSAAFTDIKGYKTAKYGSKISQPYLDRKAYINNIAKRYMLTESLRTPIIIDKNAISATIRYPYSDDSLFQLYTLDKMQEGTIISNGDTLGTIVFFNENNTIRNKRYINSFFKYVNKCIVDFYYNLFELRYKRFYKDRTGKTERAVKVTEFDNYIFNTYMIENDMLQKNLDNTVKWRAKVLNNYNLYIQTFPPFASQSNFAGAKIGSYGLNFYYKKESILN